MTRRARVLLGLGASLFVACRGDLEVDIETSVGTRAHADDPTSRLDDARRVAVAVFGAVDVSAAARTTEVIAGPARPPSSASELDDLIAAIRKGPMDEIGGPARRLAATPRVLWPEVAKVLGAPRRAPKGDYRSMLAAIGGDVPNRYGHFDLAWKKAHGFAVKRSDDWFEDLLVLGGGRVSGVLTAVYRDTVIHTSLLRAASEIAKDPAVSDAVVNVLLDVAFLHESTFRDEVSRTIARIGDEAVAPLWRASIVPPDARDEAIVRAEYAVAMLDRMDRWIPERADGALQTDPRRHAELLTAWGEAKTGGAAALLLSHADARIPVVREAARKSFIGLVEGPMPKTISKRLRLLGGGTGQAQAYLNHRQRAGVAVREALVSVDPSAIERSCEPTEPGELPTAECLEQPARHTARYFAALDARRQTQTAAAIDGALAATSETAAIAALDRLMTERPELADDPRVAALARRGAARALGAGDARTGAALSRKASVLLADEDPAAAQTLRVQALLAEATDESVPRAGREMLLTTAAALRPDHPDVTRALAELGPTVSTQAIDPRTLLVGCGGVLLGFLCLGGVARRFGSR